MIITEDVVEAIFHWQTDSNVHQLTCGKDSSHKPLIIVKEESGTIVLKCPSCDYTQNHAPDCIKWWWSKKIVGLE